VAEQLALELTTMADWLGLVDGIEVGTHGDLTAPLRAVLAAPAA
jgi:uncharacterized protein YcaQ